MADNVQCGIHGDKPKTFVCSHLVGDAVGLGFNRDEPTSDEPFPDAWCNDCEIIRSSHNGWTEESEKLLRVSLICSTCYERTRIRNTRTSTTLSDLASLRWKCGSCDEWHIGPCLDLGYAAPVYWTDDDGRQRLAALPNGTIARPRDFLTPDYCCMDDEYFFVRGVIQLPIIGTSEHFHWGVWGSLSRDNFDKISGMDTGSKRTELPPMFSWLSTRIPDYPDTVNLKMRVHVQEPKLRPLFELERTDHFLSREHHEGITPDRVKDLMMRRLPEVR